MDRRTFVKASILAAGAAAAAGASYGILRATARPRSPDGRLVRYFGSHRVAGPAPRGMPYLPLAVEDGVLVAKPRLADGTDVLRWLRYCGHGAAPGLAPNAAVENVLRYHFPSEDLKHIRPWYADRLGEPIQPGDFPDGGFGARFVWRTSDPEDRDAITGLIIRLRTGELRFPDARQVVGDAMPLGRRERATFQREFVAEGLVALSNWCTHFCCTAGYKEAEALARQRDAWERVYCACHSLVCDHREPVAYWFEPE